METTTNQSPAAPVTAYDYSAQRWLTGEAARTLRLTQLREELTLLCSERGEEYFSFTACKGTRLQAIARCEKLIKQLS